MKGAALRPAVSFNTYRKPGNEIEEGSETVKLSKPSIMLTPQHQDVRLREEKIRLCKETKRIPLLFKDPEMLRASGNELL